MISFGINEILNSALGAYALGAVFGIIYNLIFSMLVSLGGFVSVNASGGSLRKRIKSDFLSILNLIKSSHGEKKYELFDFIFTIIFGVSYFVLQFILCDGVFRIYFLLFTLLGFWCFHLMYKRLFNTPAATVLALLISILRSSFYVLSYPFSLLYKKIKRVIINKIKPNRHNS